MVSGLKKVVENFSFGTQKFENYTCKMEKLFNKEGIGHKLKQAKNSPIFSFHVTFAARTDILDMHVL